MKWQTIVRRIAVGQDLPTGVSGALASLKDLATGQILNTTTTDADGLASFTATGCSGPTQLEVQGNGAVRYQTSVVRGPDGPANISELPHILHAIGGPTGAGVVLGYREQLAVLSGRSVNTVTVSPGQAIIPGGFLYTQYDVQIVRFATVSTGTQRIDAIVAEADNNEASATFGRTRLVVLTGTANSGPAITGARTLLALVTVRSGNLYIAAGDINQATRPLALSSVRQSRPVLAGTVNHGATPLSQAISSSASFLRTSNAVVGAYGITYNIQATGLLNISYPSGGSPQVTLTLTAYDSSSNSIASTSTSVRFVNGITSQTVLLPLACSFAFSDNVGNQSIEFYLQATSNATGTVSGWSLDWSALPRS